MWMRTKYTSILHRSRILLAHTGSLELHHYKTVTPDRTWPPHLLTCMVDAVTWWLDHIESSRVRQNNRGLSWGVHGCSALDSESFWRLAIEIRCKSCRCKESKTCHQLLNNTDNTPPLLYRLGNWWQMILWSRQLRLDCIPRHSHRMWRSRTVDSFPRHICDMPHNQWWTTCCNEEHFWCLPKGQFVKGLPS